MLEIDREQRYRAQGRLVQAVHDLSLARSLAQIQETVRKAAREIAGADGATFVLREGDSCHYADEDAISPLWKGQRFPMSSCISGWAMLNRQPAILPDIYADPRIPAAAYRPTFVKSLVMVPVRIAEPIAAIGVYWAEQHAATPDEVELLQALANTTSVALENVQIYAELENRVAQRTRDLEAVNRELEAFSYSVSHDLKAPLRAILGFVEILGNQIPTAEPPAQRSMLMIRTSAEKMRQLIEDLIGMARHARTELRRAPIDLASVARDVLARLAAAEPERRVETIVADKLPAHCDAALMAVVLENLLSNAWKYTSRVETGRIEVGFEEDEAGHVIYFVRDNGAGFDPKYAGRLFAPFSRLHSAEEFPGTGIGLATVQRILHRHGGKIWAESAPGQGATFRFTCAEP